MLTEPRIDVLTLCSRSTGLTKAEVLSIARNAPKRYKVYEIPKRSGQGTRTICHPSRELKALQYFFLREILNTLPVHRSATAYEEGRSIKQNAEAHRLSRVILKVDFDSFFHSIRVANWEKFATDKFPDWSPEEHAFSQRVLFWGRGTASPECLAIGAPTSPRVSNVIMYELDEVLSAYANDADLVT